MGLFDRIRSLFDGAAPSQPAAPIAPPPPPAADPSAAMWAEAEAAHAVALQATFAARDRHWAAVGAVETDVLANLISPSFTGGPAWPTTRQAYRVVRRGDVIILATDGMGDPPDGVISDHPRNGFEMELFLETADIPAELAGAPGDVSRLKESWAFAVLKHVGEMVADAGGATSTLDRHGVVSSELPGVSRSAAVSTQLPARFVSSDDALGVLIGAPLPDFAARIEDAPYSPIRLVPVVLLTASELDHVRAGGAAARAEVADKLLASPSRHRSDLNRPSVA